MRLYNTLTRQVDDFKPIQDDMVTMYSCGPTVYNNLHIGNLSAFIYADLLRRTLVASGYDVRAVMNITDVDDKTIRDSKHDYPDLEPMEALHKLTQKYEAVFKSDIERIGNDTTAVTFIRATETIDEMIRLTQSLLDKNFAYIAEDGVYFSIKDYEAAGFTYGQLQQIDRNHEHARISNDEYDKDSASDFALWKREGKGEPSWDASFVSNGETIDMPGRPGWHIECSAMSEKLLGVPFDIHTGGIDLKFPHHENEIAQSCASTGQQVLANTFVHNNHILVDGRKMSKSLGNFITLREVEERGYNPLAFRLLVLSSHYRSESNFSWDILDAAQNRLNNWRAVIDLRWQTNVPDDEEPKSHGIMRADLFGEQLLAVLQEDLNTPEALALIDQALDTDTPAGLCGACLDNIAQSVSQLLGIDLFEGKSDITDEQKQLIKEREQARADKDWTKSDELRNQLQEQGIEVRDTPHGTIWARI